MRLSDLKRSQKARIDELSGDERLVKRLNALGMLPGTNVELSFKAPSGDPLVIEFRGFSLAIRKKDAEKITVSLGV